MRPGARLGGRDGGRDAGRVRHLLRAPAVLIRALRTRLAWQTTVAALATFALIGGAFGFLLQAVRAQRDATDHVVATQEALGLAGTVERLVVDMQNGSRGYLITESREFLQPYLRALERYPDAFRQLLETAAGARERRLTLEIGKRTTRYRYGYLEPLIELAGRDVGAARRIVAGGEGKRRVDQIRELFDELAALKREESRVAHDEADVRADRAFAIGVTGLGVTALVLVLFISYLRRAVIDPVRRLADAADRVAHGDLTARTPGVASANELGQMSTAFNAMAASLEQAFETAREAERSRDEFFALVSHELRTPLTSIVGYVELLQEDASGADPLSDEERSRFLTVINRNSRRLLRLVGDLLFVARLEAGRLELESVRFDPARPVHESVEAAEPRARDAGVELRSEVAEGLEIEGDEGRIAQALDNLISNAIKFTPEGGSVAVALRPVDGEVAIEVADTGVGIPAHEQERLFERFFRASTGSKVQGVGLGLVITRAIVAGHGGRLELESEESRGSTFRMTLPTGGAGTGAE